MTKYGEKLKAKCIRKLHYSIDILSNGLEFNHYDDDVVDAVKQLRMELILKGAQVKEMDTDSEIEDFCKRYFKEQTYEKWIEEAKHG